MNEDKKQEDEILVEKLRKENETLKMMLQREIEAHEMTKLMLVQKIKELADMQK